MITYDPFWQTMKRQRLSTYALIKEHRLSSATIDKLRRNKPLNTTTINDLCRILQCRVEEVMQYAPCEDDQTL